MPNYLYVYRGGLMPETEAEQQDSMARWGARMGKNSASFVDPGNPVMKSMTVDADGVHEGAETPTVGYTIVKADSLEAACDLARDNPMIHDGGSVEVAEIHVIEM